MKKSLGFVVLFLSAFLLFATFLTITTQEAGAQEMLIGTTGMGGTISTLVELDPATGNLIRTIGSVGYIVNGLVYDHTTGRLFASTAIGDPSYQGLIEINLATGAGTPIGVNGWGLGSGAVTNITVDSAGQMYGWWDPSEDDLVRIDKTTGIATRVGESNVGTGANGLDFDNSGTLYMVNYSGDYYSVNTTTGVATYVNNIGSMAHHGKFRPTSNIWYGIDATGSGSKNLVLANLSTSAIISTIPTVDNLHTLEFIPGTVSGTVTYTGVGTGQISIAAFDGAGCGQGNYTEVWIPGPGPYALALNPGTYYICACRDTNNNGSCPDTGEPASEYNGNPVIVAAGGVPVTGINISLQGPVSRTESVPTMTEWGMIIFIALAGLGSVYYLRRQKRA